MDSSLQKLSDELGNPSQAKLLQAARKRGIKSTAAQAKEIAGNDSSRQVFGKPFKQQGAQAATSERDRMQADLIDFKQFSAADNNDSKYALVVTDVFTREAKTKVLESKKPQEVWEAFKDLYGKLGGKPSRLDTDGGEEFQSSFLDEARKAGIAVQTRSAGDTNYLAINDRAIQTVKQTLFRKMGRDGSTRWVDKIEPAVQQYNKTPHSKLQGESPADVKDEPVVKFRLQQENAEIMKDNSNQLKGRQQALENAGSFRHMLPKQTFSRGYTPKFSNEVHNIEEIKLGRVKDTQGRFYDIARVLPVPKGSAVAAVPQSLAAGSQARDKKQSEELSAFKRPLRQFLGNDAKGMAAVGGFLRDQPGFEQKLTELRLNRPGGVRLALQAMGREFEIIGKKGQPTVRVRPTQRLRGKQ